MTEKQGSEQSDNQSEAHPLPAASQQPSGNQSSITESALFPMHSGENQAAELEKIAKGERWLIGIGLVSIAVNIAFGLVYYGQLVQMRLATKASADGVELARETLDYNASQFDRTQRQTIDQTIAAINSANTATQAVRDSETFFRTDERAWIELRIEKTNRFPPDPPFLTIYKYSVYPKNVGKTVARDVAIHINDTDADGYFAENKNAIRMFQDQLFHVQDSKKLSKIPNLPAPEVIAPGDSSTVPVFAGGQEPRRYGNYFRYSYILGRIDYRDAFGTKHWKRFCFMLGNSSGELGNCKYGNDEDSNQESSSLPK